MKPRLRRALFAAFALGGAAFACTSFEAEPAPNGDGDAATPDAPGAGPDAPLLEGDAGDAAGRAVCATTFDARACVDFEPGAIGYGATTRALNVMTALEDGGPAGSLVAQHVRTEDAASASSYELKATFDVPFTVLLDVKVRSLLTANDASTILLNVASSNGASRIYLNAHKVGDTFDLTAELDGTLDGGVQPPAFYPLASGLPLDAWVTVRANVKRSAIAYEVRGVTATVSLPAAFTPFGTKSIFAAGPATVKDDFEVLIDNLIVR